MFAFTYSAAILAIINLGFAAFLIVKKWEIKLARYLAALFASSTICLVGNALADISYTEKSLIFWAGTALIAAIFAMAIYANLIEVFTGHSITILKFALIYVPAIVLSLFAYSKYSITGTNFPFNKAAESTTGPLYFFVLGYTIILWIFSLIRVVEMRRKATVVQRAQISYIFLGFGLASLGTMLCNAILPLFGNISYFTLGPQCIIFLSAALAYTILKHGLLNIKVVIQKSIIYSVIIGAIIGFYLLIINTALIWLDLSQSVSYPIASLLAALVGAIGIPPINKFLQKKTDKIFFKDHISYSEAMYNLSLALNLNIDLNSLIESTAEELYKIFKPTGIKIYLVREKLLFERDGGPNTIKISEEDLFEILPKGDDDELFVNAEHDGANLAQILIGEKKTGEIYLPEDREILNTFSFQFALALEKTNLFERLKKQVEEKNEAA
ncbi:MAG: hypothetical protein NTW66_02775 [Candidatus Magasanikbacteria bacterium]|nr:hypothetical protein [Candidatus Magasanikbacteria bacterium]